MKDFLKKYYLNLILVLIYTGLAMTVYIVWFESLWHLWYVDMITGFVILGLGGFLGYLYIKSEMKKDEPKKEEIKKEEETKTDISDESGDGLSGE